ncbi:TPA: hypothetical protein NJ328_004880 [Vibrio parahaemolyticus]|uniref:DUF4365 domain-containing protein n=2 Tax=Vibrio parahaemolyticus TaxID=670 RepID=A0AA47L5B7_VIBPH|nr:hypothetical protein [Vibrio parahaemolyticus]EIE1275505.1 hypothetical protein [Vibrio parahaemolyticus]ELA8113403.1 hypothetical protein [Vibrio parahaemolyticus]ELA8167165.1 hypothetical protein [Vibrio parahaemolyticus]MCX8778623.1 hypothetical protein [Vibrio parahaemolyticus]MEA5352049.1 hypothetical protein [Vibrio parahaemolyticus]
MKAQVFSQSPPKVEVNNNTNSVNGGDGESKAAADLLLATRGEVKWSSREVDGRKIDIEFSAEHPWYEKENFSLSFQVKAGHSYVNKTCNTLFAPNSTLFKSIQRQSDKIGLIWVDPDKDTSQWCLIRPNSKYMRKGYGLHHKITPATLYDLARCYGRDLNKPKHGHGICISRKPKTLKVLRSNAIGSYYGNKVVLSPVLGEIKLTRLGWKHMFRKSRRAEYKETSLQVIPVLGKLLEHIPREHIVHSTKYYSIDDFEYRECEHVMSFTQVKDSNKNYLNVTVKVLEYVRYPKNWRERSYLTQLVQRETRLLSAYILEG